MEDFLNAQVSEHGISQSYQKQMVGSIKLLYNGMLRMNFKLDYLYPDRREYKLPSILTQSEVARLLAAVSNIKHRAILSTIYSAGLRVEELINLNIADIDSQSMLSKS